MKNNVDLYTLTRLLFEVWWCGVPPFRRASRRANAVLVLGLLAAFHSVLLCCVMCFVVWCVLWCCVAGPSPHQSRGAIQRTRPPSAELGDSSKFRGQLRHACLETGNVRPPKRSVSSHAIVASGTSRTGQLRVEIGRGATSR